MNDLGAEDDLNRQIGLICGHGGVEDALGSRARSVAVEAREVGVGQGVGELPRPIGAEVAVKDRVAVGDRPVVHAVDDRRRDELVVLAPGVAGLDGGNGGWGVEIGDAVDDCVVALPGPLPALVAVHGEVAAADRGDLRVRMGGREALLQVGHELDGGSRRRVPAVQEAVDADALHALAGGQFRHGDQMVVVGVDAARPHQADQVKGMVVLFGSGAQFEQDRPGEEAACRDRLADAGQVLEDRLAGPEVEVTDLRVAHLAFGQADELLGRLEGAVRPALQEAVPDRHPGLDDGVYFRLVADAEAVQDNEDDRARAAPRRVAGTGGRHAGLPSAAARALAVTAARATMPAISSGLSDAPPTRPPSIECSSRNSPMLALVTLPP